METCKQNVGLYSISEEDAMLYETHKIHSFVFTRTMQTKVESHVRWNDIVW